MASSHLDTLAALCIGFAFAGSVIEALGLITCQRIGFGLFLDNGRKGVLALPLLIMTGPVLLLRDLFSADGRELPGIAVAFGIIMAIGWGIASGHLLLLIIHAVQGIGAGF